LTSTFDLLSLLLQADYYLRSFFSAGFPFALRRSLSLILLACLFQYAGKAQSFPISESLFVTAYGLEDGLRQSMVSQVHQDSNGLIWMVTGDGLHSFDGREFRVFTIPYEGVYNSSDNMMRKLVETEHGNFVISSSSSLFRFNSSTGKFSFISREKAVYFALFDVSIDKKPLVWSLNKGFCLVDGDSLCSLKLVSGGHRKIPKGFIPLNAVNINKDVILVQGENGILQFRNNASHGTTEFTTKWIEASGCKAMVSDINGRVFIVKDTQLYLYHENEAWEEIVDLGMNISTELSIDLKDNFWFSDIGSKRLFRLSGQKITAIELLENSGKYTDTIRPSVKHIFEDKMSNLWFGTDGNGLLKYNPQKVMFEKSLIGFTRCLVKSNGSILAGTYNKGLWKLSKDLKQAERLNPGLFSSNAYILDLAIDARKRICVATRKGLFVVLPDGRLIFSYLREWETAGFINNQDDQLQLQSDSELHTFYAGQNPSLLRRGSYISINSQIIHSGAQWKGTPVGLFYTQVRDEKDLPELTNHGILISHSEIFQILASGNEVWAATGNGIEIFSSTGQSLNPYPALSALKDEAIYTLLSDEQGRIWFSGIRGLGCITRQRDRVIRFSLKNNLQSLEFNHNAACKGPDGRLYFGGINGVNAIDPALFTSENQIPPVRLFSLTVSDTLYTAGIPLSNLRIRLGREAAHLSGSVFTTDYHDIADQGFSFFLEGYQKDWSLSSPDAGFSYRNLPPGEYRLFVRYTDPFQNQGEPELLLTLKVDPAFWQTWWFTLGLIISFIIITVLIVRRIQGIRYANRIKALEQEHAIEKERLRISKDMHDEVGASLTRISILSEIAKSRQQEPAKSQEVIQQISEIAGNVVDELSEIIWAMNPKNDSLDSFSAYVRRYASTYLEPTATLVKFHFPDDVPPLHIAAELRRNLFLAIKESLHNIVKHAKAENVLITLRIDKKHLNIILKDDGDGFSEELLTGTGNGLINMRRRMEECGRELRIVSGKGKGTEIDFSVDL
jgi:signal transduction histidine kinase/ligand-binding sensor domain-containing protein